MHTFSALLEQLHDASIRELLRRVESGEATAADMAVAVKLLKDNGINADARKNPALSSLAKTMALPFDDDDVTDDLTRLN